jgi:3-amino-4-hydroxybenzoic acid synthase
MSRSLIWFDAREIADEDRVLLKVYHLNYEYLLIRADMLERVKPPSRMKLIVEVTNGEELEAVSGPVTIFSNRTDLLNKAKELGYKTAWFTGISNHDGMDLAWRLGMNYDFLVVELLDETNIPLELLIARLQSKATGLLKAVTNTEAAGIALGVMEVGSDGVLFQNEDLNEILTMDLLMEQETMGKIELSKAKVTAVQHMGMGYRACIDTTDILKENEGMIIGSTSCGGLLVCSETHFLPYMELRPFRVNAGAVHSYVWSTAEMTAYLTELKAGSTVLCVDTDGNTREVRVGRVKIEKRPLLKIEVEAERGPTNAIIQDDWHIRIFGANGEVRNASTIKVGEELLAYVCDGGRHVGIKINETIIEK